MPFENTIMRAIPQVRTSTAARNATRTPNSRRPRTYVDAAARPERRIVAPPAIPRPRRRARRCEYPGGHRLTTTYLPSTETTVAIGTPSLAPGRSTIACQLPGDPRATTARPSASISPTRCGGPDRPPRETSAPTTGEAKESTTRIAREPPAGDGVADSISTR